MSTSASESSGSLQQFLVLLKSAKGKAAELVVSQALGAPGVYHFADLLAHPNVQALAPSPIYELARLFAYGTLADYRAAPAGSLPELTPPQLKRLRQLSLVTLATQSKSISYSTLQTALELQHVRELEDLIIDCIYAGLLQGKLDQKDKQLQVDMCLARDLRPGQLRAIAVTLNQWCDSADSLLQALEQQRLRSQQSHEEYRNHRKEFETKLENIKSTVKATMEAEGMGGGIMGDPANYGGAWEDDRFRKKAGKRGGAGGRPKGAGGGKRGAMGFFRGPEGFS
jgi:COP9 signalosome complex subunit 7